MRLKEKNIILTGFMGAGKSSVGKLLAAQLERRFIDTDQLVEEEAALSIAEIFNTQGEAAFRELEAKAAQKLLNFKAGTVVVATGGGLVQSAKNRRLLKRAGTVILLKVSAEEALKRVASQKHRPLLREGPPLEKIKALLEQREHFYADCHLSIKTDGKSEEEVCAEILQAL